MNLACATGKLGALLVDLTTGVIGVGVVALVATFVLLLVIERHQGTRRARSR